MAERPSWSGHLRLSLVTCPVVLYNALSSQGDVHFNLINPDTGNRIRSVAVDSVTEEPLERKDLVKGYEISKGEYVIMTPEELDSVRLESTSVIDIDKFVDADKIDRLYWDHPYYLAPDGDMAEESFAVIASAMAKTNKVALGRVVMAQRERLMALEPRDGGIVATTLRDRDELREAAKYFEGLDEAKASREMVTIAEKIIRQKEGKFDPSTFKDRYEDALRDLIAQKEKGRKIVRPKEPSAPHNVIDLMEALKASLNEKGGARTSAKAPAKKSAASSARRPARTTQTKKRAAKPKAKSAAPASAKPKTRRA